MLSIHEIIKSIEAEFNRINIPEKKFHSDHEAWAVLLEEVEELDSELKPINERIESLKKRVFLDWGTPGKLEDLDYIYEHAVLAAVAIKFIKLKEKRVADDADNN